MYVLLTYNADLPSAVQFVIILHLHTEDQFLLVAWQLHLPQRAPFHQLVDDHR